MVEARRCQEWAHPSAQPSVPTLGNRAQGHWTLGSWAAGAAAGKPAHRRAAATAQARPSAAEASPGTPGRLPRTKAALRPEVGPEKATGLAMQAARRTARVEAEGSADRDVPACQRRSVPRRPSPPAPAAVRPTVRRVPGLAAVQTTVRRDAATAARRARLTRCSGLTGRSGLATRARRSERLPGSLPRLAGYARSAGRLTAGPLSGLAERLLSDRWLSDQLLLARLRLRSALTVRRLPLRRTLTEAGLAGRTLTIWWLRQRTLGWALAIR